MLERYPFYAATQIYAPENDIVTGSGYAYGTRPPRKETDNVHLNPMLPSY